MRAVKPRVGWVGVLALKTLQNRCITVDGQFLIESKKNYTYIRIISISDH